jgi:hypothetical protein
MYNKLILAATWILVIIFLSGSTVLVLEMSSFKETKIIKAVVTKKEEVFNESAVQEVNFIYVFNAKKSVSLEKYRSINVGDSIDVVQEKGTIWGMHLDVNIK